MSTRSVIAKRTGEHTFEGTYHHSDGYPTGVGATLHELYNGYFRKDLPAMLDYLLAHSWSTINGSDFSQPPGFIEHPNYPRIKDGSIDWEAFTKAVRAAGPKCYCHGDRSEEPWILTQDTASNSGREWAYVFDCETDEMLIMSSYHENGTKAIGFFGMGDPDAVWVIVGKVVLDNPLDNNQLAAIENGEILVT